MKQSHLVSIRKNYHNIPFASVLITTSMIAIIALVKYNKVIVDIFIENGVYRVLVFYVIQLAIVGYTTKMNGDGDHHYTTFSL
jgi:hypothetical protein